MVFEVPASRASIKQNQFEFKVPGERKTRALPLLKFVPVGYRDRLQRLAEPIREAQAAGETPSNEVLAAFGSFQIDLLEKYAPGITDLMDDEQLAALLKAWTEASGVSVGELPVSAGS